MKQCLSSRGLVLSVCFTLGSAGSAVGLLTSCASKPAGSSSSIHQSVATPRVVLLYTSDLHGRLMPDPWGAPGYAKIAALIAAEKLQAGPKTDVLALVGGDVANKSAMPCRNTKEQACFEFLRTMGFDLAVLGGGELLRSAEELNGLVRASGLTWIAGNVQAAKTSAEWKKQWIWDGAKSGARFAFVGGTTGPSPGEIDLARAGYRLSKDPLSSYTLNDREKWRDRSLVILTHQEWADDLQQAQSFCKQEAAPQTLVWFKANDHTVRNDSSVCSWFPILEAGAFGKLFWRVVLEPDSSGVWRRVSVDTVDAQSFSPSLSHENALKLLYQKHGEGFSAQLAVSDMNRSQSDLAGWLAYAFRQTTRADVAIVNSGAVKEDLPPGSWSREMLQLVFPYDNELVGLDWSVDDLQRSLCSAAKRSRDEIQDYGSELHLAGAVLEQAGTPECRLVLPKRLRSVKVVMSEFVAGRSERWLGKNIRPLAFRFGVRTHRAMELHLSRSQQRL